MKRWKLALAFAACSISGPVYADTTMEIGTGYDYNTFGLYLVPSSTTSNRTDNFWIKIAAYEPPATTVAVAPAWVLNTTGIPWALALPNSRWIGGRSVSNSTSGTNSYTPAYTLYRKCFCLMSGYKNPSISFRARADDKIQVWLNTDTNTLLGPVFGNPNGAVLTSLPSNASMFKVGPNCIYVLVEDTVFGRTGFDLSGTVTAAGLMPAAASGVNASFAPCTCPTSGPTGPVLPNAGADAAVVQSILKIAETRRRSAVQPTQPN